MNDPAAASRLRRCSARSSRAARPRPRRPMAPCCRRCSTPRRPSPRACAQRGLIPPAAAEAIAGACDAERYDIAAIGREGARHAQPVVALVQALRAAVGTEAAPHVHHGATSQDILDTALMLVAKRALVPLTADLLAPRTDWPRCP